MPPLNTLQQASTAKHPLSPFKVVQAGKQLEILSGGLVKAGYHEVVYNAATDRAVQKMKQERPGRPLIRISSTLVRPLSSGCDIRSRPARLTHATFASVLAPELRRGDYAPARACRAGEGAPRAQWRGRRPRRRGPLQGMGGQARRRAGAPVSLPLLVWSLALRSIRADPFSLQRTWPHKPRQGMSFGGPACGRVRARGRIPVDTML